MARKARSARNSGQPPAGVAERAIAAALGLAESQGWGEVALRDIAAEAGLSFAELYARFSSKQAILNAFARDVDGRILAGSESDPPEGSARDRLFDLVMRRFDLLQPHREALRSILRASGRDPLAIACGARALARSMATTLEAAGIPAGGLRGLVRVKGLSAIYLAVLRRWLGDDSDDRAATMALLDKLLTRAESGLAMLRCGKSRSESGEAVAVSPE
jgi:AcrR family transcriptional regulator